MTVDELLDALEVHLEAKGAKAMASLKKRYSEAKKVVKMEIDQTRWVEFGILDKR